jgi:hypothetical protein
VTNLPFCGIFAEPCVLPPLLLGAGVPPPLLI